ncbi:S-DNA-T family DNA segregation ATPase FtsK/SpoIIIE [Lachnotalea glycerini]|uniref:S-DNA-T family DNA segregation ATPase FtsK/SpoIIIE n=1 Tax=Lachnotalea glycerini TaxID=1763509 RepID=A0A318EVT1_9FIRM|nr:type VII secretion protein EssC [Lachnotalea glycerini]PXV89565.1 S-DNA-T family DNA segregation ATPase FtsK/SpoIIIE [Lachnotalea glycerini]
MKNESIRTMLCYKRKDYVTIGPQIADIIIKDIPFSFILEHNKLIISLVNESLSNIEVYLNRKLLEDERSEIDYGDELLIGDYRFVLLKDKIFLESVNQVEITSTLLELPYEENISEDFPKYKRSPRIIKKVSDQVISISRPKERKENKKGGLIALLLPSLVMMGVTVGTSILLKRGLLVIMSVASTGITMIVSGVKYFVDRKELREENALREKTYQKYLLNKRKEIYEAFSNETEAYRYNYPSILEIEKMIHCYSARVYERSSNDEDFLSVSIGNADVPCKFKIKMETSELNNKIDLLEEEARAVVNEFSNMKQPIVIDLKKAHMGLVGEKDTIHDQLKLMIAQLTFFQSYHDLEIITIYNESYDEDFKWMRWYPHLRIHAINAVGTINNERKRDQILGSIHQILKDRKLKVEESKKESMFLPHLLFVIDEPKFIMDHSIMEYLDKEGYNLGFSIIYTTNNRANLPENIGTIVILENSKQATLLLEEKEEKNLHFSLESSQNIDLEWMARDLGVLEHIQGISAQIPENISFFQMYHVEHPQQMKILERWEKNNSSKSLAVPLGVRAEEDFVYLNLHEKAHGPHGLVAGTTGSGKSEIIQSYILSLAVNFHPYEVAFLLIDYKGGGMAGLFKNLPHVLGSITNLDGAQSMRAMASIKSELARRQRIFSAYDVNHINSYNTLFKNGEAKEPLPHLFIISDEFAELKKEQPDFMKELVSAARIGRSLGVHLILATQKPSGVVDDQIWTNSKFKLALMVQNEADSKEIIKTPDAANITKAGRAYLQVGNNEIYELFQSAWSGASYHVEKEEEKVDDRVYLINDLGQGELINQDLSNDQENNKLAVTQLDATIEYIRAIYEKQDTIEVKRPWLPPLREQIKSKVCLVDSKEKKLNLKVSVGLVDIPEEQAQKEYIFNMEKDGNLLYLASAGYGKTVFLTTMILSLAMQNSPGNLNFYILDFGNSGLIPLNKLHHMAEYITFDDTERLNKLQMLLQNEIQVRKKLLASRMVQNFEVYNQVAEKPMKAIVLVIDNFDVVKELGYEMEDFFMKLSRDGYGLGIYMITTATRSNAMKYSIYNNFKIKIAGYLIDESDVNMIVGRSTYKQSEIKGRTLIKWNNAVSTMHIYTMTEFQNEIEYNKGIEELVEQIDQIYPNQKAPRIPVLPENLSFKELLQYEKAGESIWLGLDKESVSLCGFERIMTPFTILGEAAKGKTNILKVILEQIIGTDPIYLFDSKSMELYCYKERENLHYVEGAVGIQALIEELAKQIQERNSFVHESLMADPSKNPKEISKTLSPFYIVVDDWDNFIEVTKASALQLAPLLMETAAVGISIILTAHSGKMKGFDDLTKFAKNTIDGLLVGGPGTTGMFGVTSSKELPQFRDGLLFNNGSYVRIRLPKFL